MPRFVIHEHSLSAEPQRSHWDIMLEEAESLATWQVNRQWPDWAESPVPCRKIFNHRLKYLTYEGPLSGDRGEIKIVGSGEYHLLKKGEKNWKARLTGDNINGIIELRWTKGSQWILNFQRGTP